MSAPLPDTGLPDTLAAVAGRRMSLVGALFLPGYSAGAILSDGPARWLMIAIAVLFVIPAVVRARPARPDEARMAAWRSPASRSVSS